MSLKIRNLVMGEDLPERLRSGYESTSMPEWIWVAERDGKVTAILVTAPAHILVILMRVCSIAGANPMDVRALLVNAMAEIRERGYKGYVTWVDPTVETENALMGIIKASGGGQLVNPQVACYGTV